MDDLRTWKRGCVDQRHATLVTRPYPQHIRFEGITDDAGLMGGVPTIRKLRIPVATVVSMVTDGMTVDEIVPDLTPGDIAEALRYAAETVRERQLPSVPLHEAAA